MFVVFCKQKTAYEMRISDWSSDVCSSDLGEDRRIRVVDAYRAECVEAAQVVLAGRVVAVPGYHVQRRMPDRRAPQVALELGDQLEVALGLLVRRIRGEEVSLIGKAVGADRPQVRQPQQAAEVLAHVAARGTVRQRDAEEIGRAHV